MYGVDNGGVYIVFNPMKSLAEVDQGLGDSKQFMSAMNDSERKKLAELEASCIESSQTNLFVFDPKISYPWEEWIKADSFWKPKATASEK
jgi:O-succinylbenzoate synthase